jgi:uncharacterized protein YndB with AHSA1/START domain
MTPPSPENAMSARDRSEFVYVTFIRTTPAKLWEALTEPRFIRQYWFGITVESGWQQGSPWTLRYPGEPVDTTGEILEIDPPRRLVLRWQNEARPELEPVGNAVKLTITHELERPDSKLITAVSGGWPQVLSNLKSLLETGEVVVVRGAKPAATEP